eukprot:scaffold261_cov58-Cyclotella_meneghiniana.AAC.12
MSPMREKFARDLRPRGRLPTLENAINAVQKLLDSNKSILSRCHQAFDTSENKLSRKVLLTKRVFDYVKSNHVDGKLLFTTTPEYSEKEFNIEPLIKLPPELAILHPKRIKYGLIDYESLFKMSSALDDSSNIRISYLANLKHQLMLVQSCLNSIEMWWNESPTNLCFLESIFGADAVHSAEVLKNKDPLCRKCCRHYSFHLGNSKLCSKRWPGGNFLFQRSRALPLKVFFTSYSVVDKFDLFDENERAQLVRLVTFVSHNVPLSVKSRPVVNQNQ